MRYDDHGLVRFLGGGRCDGIGTLIAVCGGGRGRSISRRPERHRPREATEPLGGYLAGGFLVIVSEESLAVECPQEIGNRVDNARRNGASARLDLRRAHLRRRVTQPLGVADRGVRFGVGVGCCDGPPEPAEDQGDGERAEADGQPPVFRYVALLPPSGTAP